jgi:dihydroxy-acid dehydratase
MSGTASGSVILHISPESAVGGPLAAVREGDEIELDTEARTLQLHVPDQELQQRLEEWHLKNDNTRAEVRGYRRLYKERVLQADRGADFDFLTAIGR